VQNVNGATISRLVLTFGTYAVRNVNAPRRFGARLTKCTGKPRPPP
jgi:hypothetical protein